MLWRKELHRALSTVALVNAQVCTLRLRYTESYYQCPEVLSIIPVIPARGCRMSPILMAPLDLIG